MGRGWGHGADDCGLRVAAERILEDPGELGVAVRDVGLGAVGELANHSAEREQALVDVAGLGEPVAGRTGVPDAFRPGEVDQIELGHPDRGVVLRVRRLAFDSDLEDGVRPARRLVHLRRRDLAAVEACLKDVNHGLRAANGLLGQIADVDFAVEVLFDLEVGAARLKQVCDGLQFGRCEGAGRSGVVVHLVRREKVDGGPRLQG